MDIRMLLPVAAANAVTGDKAFLGGQYFRREAALVECLDAEGGKLRSVRTVRVHFDEGFEGLGGIAETLLLQVDVAESTVNILFVVTMAASGKPVAHRVGAIQVG